MVSSTIGPVLRRDVGAVAGLVLEVRLFEHGRLVDVVIGCDPDVMGDFRQAPDVFQVDSRDVDVEEDAESVDILLLDQVFEVRPDRFEGFRQLLTIRDRIDGEVESGDARIAEPIDHIGTHQAPVGRDIDPEALPRGIIGHFVREIRSEQDLAAHQRQHPAAGVVQPVDRARAVSSVMPFTRLSNAQQ